MWNPGWQRTLGSLVRCLPLSARPRRWPWRAWQWWAACCPVPSSGESRGCTWVGDGLRSGKGVGALWRRQQTRLPRLLPCTCTDKGINCQRETWQCPAGKWEKLRVSHISHRWSHHSNTSNRVKQHVSLPKKKGRGKRNAFELWFSQNLKASFYHTSLNLLGDFTFTDPERGFDL